MLVYTAHDGGAVVALWAPASATLPDGTTVDIDTSYPFSDGAVVVVNSSKATPVYLRIPGWASAATVNDQPVKNGTMWKGETTSGTTLFKVAFNPHVRLEEWDAGAVSVHRGALMYSLPITPNYTIYAHHFGSDTMSNDYYLEPTSPWRFALDVDPHGLDRSLKFFTNGYKEGAAPFNHSNWPTQILAPVRPLPSWRIEKNSAATPPQSPACVHASPPCGPTENRQLVPHGGTELRIGELPLAGFAHADGHVDAHVAPFVI